MYSRENDGVLSLPGPLVGLASGLAEHYLLYLKRQLTEEFCPSVSSPPVRLSSCGFTMDIRRALTETNFSRTFGAVSRGAGGESLDQDVGSHVVGDTHIHIDKGFY